MARHLSQAEIDRIAAAGRALLQQERGPAPPPVNLDATLELGEPIRLVWDGEEFQIKAISYREALQLQRFTVRLSALFVPRETPPTEAEIDATETLMAEVTDFLCTLLDPELTHNPFAFAEPLEVGELLGFFFACRMKQAARRPSRLEKRSPGTWSIPSSSLRGRTPH